MYGKTLFNIKIIHQTDKGENTFHPLISVPEKPAPFLCGTEGGDKREGDLFPTATGLLHKVATKKIESELDNICTLLLRNDRGGGIGQRCNDLHMRRYAVG
jgi:hypothetical protein